MGKAKAKVVAAEVFVRAWQESDNVAEVAKKTGLTLASCQARASKYRSLGVSLKNMTRGAHKKIDVSALNALINGAAESTEVDTESEVTDEVATETTEEVAQTA